MKRLSVLILALLLSMSFAPTFAQTAADNDDDDDAVPGVVGSYAQRYRPSEGTTVETNPGAPLEAINVVLVMETEEDAEKVFAMLRDEIESDDDVTFEEVDDLGDEAFSAVGADEDGELMITGVFARDGEVIVAPYLRGEEADLDLAREITEFIIETGPSDDEEKVEDDIVTGGWADAFPQPDDIEGLSHFEPAKVYFSKEIDF